MIAATTRGGTKATETIAGVREIETMIADARTAAARVTVDIATGTARGAGPPVASAAGAAVAVGRTAVTKADAARGEWTGAGPSRRPRRANGGGRGGTAAGSPRSTGGSTAAEAAGGTTRGVGAGAVTAVAGAGSTTRRGGGGRPRGTGRGTESAVRVQIDTQDEGVRILT